MGELIKERACSVCIATYDKADCLYPTLRSIFNQRPPFPFEVIVVDDGTPNGTTASICAFFGVRYLRNHREPGWRNPAVARNLALKMAKHPIIVQQSDDVIHALPSTLEELVIGLQPGQFHIARVYDFIAQTGQVATEYTPLFNGLGEPRPFFFLGSCWREDIYKIGGYDEEFVLAGYDDNWHGDCLIKGLGLTPVYSRALGLHQNHHRPQHNWRTSEELYKAKVAAGVFCAAGGPWRLPEE